MVRAGSLTVGGRHDRRDRRALFGRERRADCCPPPAPVKAAGATALRGGAFKPRTSPYSFQGLKEDGLKLLAAARGEPGLAVVTEVMATEDVELVARYADVLQIGARNMQNYRLLEAVGKAEAAGAPQTRPLRHDGRTAAGGRIHPRRGQSQRHALRARHSHLRNRTRVSRSPLASVLYLHAKTHLPVVVDPSHGTGHTYLVPQHGRRQRRGRRRRPDPGSPPRSRERA